MALCHIGSRVGATGLTSPPGPHFSDCKLGSTVRTTEGPALRLALAASPHGACKHVTVEEPSSERGEHGATIHL